MSLAPSSLKRAKLAPSSKAHLSETEVIIVQTLQLAYHKRKLRQLAKDNSKMAYLNVQLLGLSGRPHPVLPDIHTTQDVKKLCVHIKLLPRDFLTGESASKDQHQLCPASPLCSAPVETISHVLVQCKALSNPPHRVNKDCLPSTTNLENP